MVSVTLAGIKETPAVSYNDMEIVEPVLQNDSNMCHMYHNAKYENKIIYAKLSFLCSF